MSISSGRKGSCIRCGYRMNGYAKSSDSKCGKCKKTFDICQVMYYGQEGGRNPRG
ncbi:hypothetical protein EDB80DRAFT_700632 [Ilyonectria destructans]|nr:hypothetical protein EDB80DRAFT_700632 [Ilyonectria destructans]